MEKAAIDMIHNVEDYVENVDIFNAQYDLPQLYEEMQKMGLDGPDLEEYGFDLRSAVCGGQCQSYAEYKMKGDEHISRMTAKGIEMYRKASCHPFMKEHVVPKVEFIWYFLPFNFCCGIPGLFINIICCPCTWCIQIPIAILA